MTKATEASNDLASDRFHLDWSLLETETHPDVENFGTVSWSLRCLCTILSPGKSYDSMHQFVAAMCLQGLRRTASLSQPTSFGVIQLASHPP